MSRNHVHTAEDHERTQTSFAVDEVYLKELSQLRENLEAQGVDVTTREGRKIFVTFLRRLNARFV